MERVIVYVDGFNLYFGLRDKGWRRYYWLNIVKLGENLLKKDQILAHTKYFTSRVKDNPEKIKRQNAFLEALGTLSGLTIFYGKYLIKDATCRNCGYIFKSPSEKMTDVNIAVEMLMDAVLNRYDTAILVSADSDLTGPVKAIRKHFPGKRVLVAIPPERQSLDLKKAANAFIFIGKETLKDSLFPENIPKPDGFMLKRPDEWK